VLRRSYPRVIGMLRLSPLLAAFPKRLRADAATVVAVMPRPPSRLLSAFLSTVDAVTGRRFLDLSDEFTVTVAGEPVTIPQRIYNPEQVGARLTETQALILHCLYSRHHDGFVRQRHLKELLAHPQEWRNNWVVRARHTGMPTCSLARGWGPPA
jgi:hypothetical protein